MNVKKLIPIVFIVLLVLAWYISLSGLIGAPMKYKDHLEMAKKYEKEGRYQYAIEEYDAAIEIKPDKLTPYLNQMKDYEKLGDYDSMLAKCEYIISNFKDNKEAYLAELNYYMEEEQLKTASEIVVNAKEAYEKDKEIDSIYTQLKGSYYELYMAYPEMSAFRYGCAMVVDEDGRHGIITENGEMKVSARYEYAGMYSTMEDVEDQVAPICKDGEWYYIDEKGYKAMVNEKEYEYLGSISEGIMCIAKDGKYGYASWDYENRSFAAKTKLQWDDAGTMYNGTAAVCKDGKWALINSEFKEITEYKYDEIVLDDFGICSRNAVVFVKEGEKYKLIGTNGKDITKAEFDDVKPFGGGTSAAVCKDGKWGFIDTEGKTVIKYQYEDARSFSDKYAPVCENGQWGYINEKNQLVMDYQFDDAKQFTENGVAPVKMMEQWKLIKLYIY